MKLLNFFLPLVIIAFVFGCKEEKTQNDKNVVIKHKEERLYKGMFTYVAKTDEVAFTECNQEFTISVALLKDNDFNSLFEAYKKIQANTVLDFAYVEFKGYITDKVVASEMDDMKTIRVTKFLKIDKNKSCN